MMVESSLHISFIPWIFALNHIKIDMSKAYLRLILFLSKLFWPNAFKMLKI